MSMCLSKNWNTDDKVKQWQKPGLHCDAHAQRTEEAVKVNGDI